MIKNQNEETLEQEAATYGPWFILATKPNCERLARFHLENQKFKVYLPMTLGPKHKGQATIRPLFPSYMFVRIASDRWSPLRSTIGVREVLTFGERPLPVSHGLVKDLKDKEIDGLVRVGPPLPVEGVNPHKAGDLVRVAKGVNGAMIEALCEEVLDANRIRILFTMLGREWHKSVPNELVTKIAS